MYIRIRKGKVLEIKAKREGYSEIWVDTEDGRQKAINYDYLVGSVKVGDEVFLNTSAVFKKLGTGGYHFVISNEANPKVEMTEEGHIMKLRYTPIQVKVLSIEEEEHPLNYLYQKEGNLDKMPVLIGTLHSMLAPLVATLQYLAPRKLKIAYLMTDGASLPAYLSNILAKLREENLLDSVITCGHAFGGDLEAVTVYSGLLAAQKVVGADIVIALMGPGIVGTGSDFGFTGTEQGELVNAVNVLGGKAVAIPRISFSDKRSRHFGISHHTKTALAKIALTPCEIIVPNLPIEQEKIINQQLEESGLAKRHKIIKIDAIKTKEALDNYNLKVSTMGRNFEQDEAFFLTVGAAGIYGASLF